MSSAEDLDQLDLRYHDLNKIDCNQARASASSVGSNPKNAAPKDTPPGKDELQLRQMKLPLKLPQRRKFITLAEANSASFGLNFHVDLEEFASLGSSAFQKSLDLPLVEDQEDASEQVELPAMIESKEEAFHETVEMIKIKKKLLAQLAEGPGATVDSETKGQRNESRFHRSSNPSRTCRFCGREFPSGRALGGHMRVHGALIFTDTSPSVAEQEQRNYGELENFRSVDQMDPHLSSRGQVEDMKRSSFTNSSNSSQMNLEMPNQAIHLDAQSQEDDDEEEEQDEEGGEKVTRMVNLSSFECTSSSLINKPRELLGCGDTSSELLSGKRKPAAALYELRRNPKPNQRFFRGQECRSLSYAIWNNSLAAGGTPRSRSPSPEHERACSECGKVFSSWKALFGHMRCHPERDWRGIQPPERAFELDRTPRSVTPKASNAEISFAEKLTNCEHIGSVLSHVENEGKTTAKLQQDASLKQKVLDASTGALSVPATKETAASSTSTQKWGMCKNMEPRQSRDAAKRIEQGDSDKIAGDDNIAQGPASKKAECTSKKNSMKIRSAAEHVDCPAAGKEATKAWSASWCTRKRSKRNRSGHAHPELSFTSEQVSNDLRVSQQDARLDDQEDLEMANCLVLLSHAGSNTQAIDGMHHDDTDSAFSHQVKKQKVLSMGIISERRLSRAGMGAIQACVKVHEDDYGILDDDIDDDACDVVENNLATSSVGVAAENHASFNTEVKTVKYQCSTCKKCFNSHQALGGHRASHKKIKGCFAQIRHIATEAQQSSEENVTEDDLSIEHIKWQSMEQGKRHHEQERSDACIDPILKMSSKQKIKGHECSICHRIFASGQALGGHKRCHWNGERYVTDTASMASSNKQSSVDEKSEWVSKSNGIKQLIAKEDTIDLNLPAPYDEDDEAALDNLLRQGTGELLLKTAKEEGAVDSPMAYAGATRKQTNGTQDYVIVKDFLGGAAGSFLHETREIEGRFRFDRRPPMWNHEKWDNAAGTRIPQVCSLKIL